MVVKRILIVEEHKGAADALLAGLYDLDARLAVICVSSAQAALSALEESRFDLLVADVLLPGISGLELMARFRRRNPAARAILLSSDAEVRKQAARSGADALLSKPVDLADFLDAVERQLGLVRSILPPELSPQDATASQGIAQQLADLRFNLQAHCAMLVSPQGHVVARAGVLPNTAIEADMLTHAVGLLHSAARMAARLNADPDDLVVVRGPAEHFHFTSVGSAYILVVVTKPLAPARAAALSEALHRAVGSLTVGVQPPVPDPEPQGNIHLGDTDPHLEKLLDLAETKPTSAKAVERFWQAAELAPVPLPGALSYAQAAQIGLAPADDL